MRYKYILTVSIFLLLSINNWAQSTYNIKKAKYKRASEAYGYIKGQEYSLNLIKSEFPKFENSILKAQTDFNSNFGKSIEKIEDYLQVFLGKDDFEKYVEKLESELIKIYSNKTFTIQIATNYINEIENRAKGKIASPVLETLLSFQYSDKPQDEYLAGFTKIYKTKNHPKSKNTDWQIKVPISWKGEEAERPNIIQKFTDDFGDGNQSIMLMVMPLPKVTNYTKKELTEFFNQSNMKNMIPENGKFISYTKMTIDNNSGGMLEIELTQASLDVNIKMRMVQFMFIYNNKMYILQCVLGSEKIETNLSFEMQKSLPLFKLIARSIVVNEQYK